MPRLDNRVAIVTGAGRNIGEAVAHAFAREGAKVAVVDLDQKLADGVAAAINADHAGAALAIVADVSSGADVQRMVNQVVERFGGVDILVNMASMSGHMGRPEATAYTAAKAAILNLTRSVAIQLAPYGVRVNSITPNQIGTPVGLDYVPERRQVKNLVGRPGKPEDIAAAAVFLVSDDGDFITAADMLVDGGALAGGSAFSGAPQNSSPTAVGEARRGP